MAFESLRRHRFAVLTTWRRNGVAVATPVWVVVEAGKAYVVSRGPGKVRRIRNNPTVEIGPSDSRGRPRGAQEPGVARVVPGALPDGVRRGFRRKYGPFPAVGRAVAKMLRKELVLLEISPGGIERN